LLFVPAASLFAQNICRLNQSNLPVAFVFAPLTALIASGTTFIGKEIGLFVKNRILDQISLTRLNLFNLLNFILALILASGQ